MIAFCGIYGGKFLNKQKKHSKWGQTEKIYKFFVFYGKRTKNMVKTSLTNAVHKVIMIV